MNQEDLVYLDSYIETLENMAKVWDMSTERAKEILQNMKKQWSTIYIALDSKAWIVGTLTLLLEQKFLRWGAYAAHIEDIAVRKWFEKQGIWTTLIWAAITKAREENCYKIILDCDDFLVPYYERFNFKQDGIFMRRYL